MERRKENKGDEGKGGIKLQTARGKNLKKRNAQSRPEERKSELVKTNH